MLLLALNPASSVPLYRQIMDGVREMIASGTLAPGERLPSIRELAGALRVNPTSAVKAYNELQHAGLIVLDQGRGTFVSQAPAVKMQTREALMRDDLEQLLTRAAARGVSPASVLEQLRRLVRAKGDA